MKNIKDKETDGTPKENVNRKHNNANDKQEKLFKYVILQFHDIQIIYRIKQTIQF